MLIEIYEKPSSYDRDDAEILTENAVMNMLLRGIEVVRYDSLMHPEKFEGLAPGLFPAVFCDGKEMARGKYDFSFVRGCSKGGCCKEKSAAGESSGCKSAGGCAGCAKKGSCGGCTKK